MNDKLKVKRSVKNGRSRNSQKGALLIGLIIAMVIFSALIGGLVFIFSSSTMNPVSGKFSQQAYYNAEAGFRYLTAVYRKETTPEAGKTALLYYIYDPAVSGAADARTITLPTGTAVVRITGLATTSPYDPGKATAALSGSNLTLTGVTGTFPPTGPGFFQIAGDETLYRYLTSTSDPITGVITALNEIYPTIPTATPPSLIETKEHATITSMGSVGGSWNVNRKVTYAWPLSGIVTSGTPIGGGSQLPTNEDILANPAFTTGASLGKFAAADVGGSAIGITQTTGGNAEAVFGYLMDPNPFQEAWTYAGKYLSYDMQIKIGTGVWASGSGFNKTEATSPAPPSASSVAANGYIAGLTFRSEGTTAGKWNQLGLDFAKYSRTSKGAFPPNLIIYPDLAVGSYPPNTVGWSPNDLKFVKCNNGTSNCSVTKVSGNLVLGSGWDITYDPPPMILLWIRFGNSSSADDYWLAYKQLNTSDGIVETGGYLKDWSTITIRVVEGASLKFTGSTGFAVGDKVTGATSGATGMVFKKIQECNVTPCSTNTTVTNGNDVIILNNVVNGPGNTTFSTGEKISSPIQADTPNTLYRPRDNYIWAMFGDTATTHGPPDAIGDPDGAVNDYRAANLRNTDIAATGSIDQTNTIPIDATNINCYIHWAETKIADWGKQITETCGPPPPGTRTTNTVNNDYFKLIRWDALNPAAIGWPGSSTVPATKSSPVEMLIMGTGKEAGAILRIDKWTTGSYTAAAFPYEIGFHSLGTSALKTYFDDLAINFPGQYKPGGLKYAPPIQY